ncbi:hypothetical protein ACFE04_026790 [Oxalis oulophora]
MSSNSEHDSSDKASSHSSSNGFGVDDINLEALDLCYTYMTFELVDAFAHKYAFPVDLFAWHTCIGSTSQRKSQIRPLVGIPSASSLHRCQWSSWKNIAPSARFRLQKAIKRGYFFWRIRDNLGTTSVMCRSSPSLTKLATERSYYPTKRRLLVRSSRLFTDMNMLGRNFSWNGLSLVGP